MKIGFYYHIPIHKENSGELKIPGYLGVFLDSIANEVETLYLFLHQYPALSIENTDYVLKSRNIEWINLGIKKTAWKRELRHKFILKKNTKFFNEIDALVVRAPSPLAPYFCKYCSPNKIFYLIVGDYSEGVKKSKAKTLRDKVVNMYLRFNVFNFNRALIGANIIVNSDLLLEKYKKKTQKINLVRTTTISESSFYTKDKTILSRPIQLLYTGRLDLMKGLQELIEAVKVLLEQSIDVQLNLVGWEESKDEPVKSQLLNFARNNNIQEKVIFHGKKQVGKELNAMYRMSDIYTIPSYHEGFPRTIWEAMANSLPVIATKVGGIPNVLSHKVNSILIDSKSINQIADAVKLIINDTALRKDLIKNGLSLAKQNTLEFQTNKLLSIIENRIDHA